MAILNFFQETLDEMPEVFTSNFFAKAARKNGMPDEYVSNGFMARFLSENAERMTRRSWRRITAPEPWDDNDPSPINAAIDLLKANGYKVMRSVEQWEEM